MTRAAVTKLLLLVILAFIICLPEFFTSYRVSKVYFLCLPSRTCTQQRQVKLADDGETGKADVKKKDMCDPLQDAAHEKWEQTCAQESQNNTSDSASDSRDDRADHKLSWFMCETRDTNTGENYSSGLSSVRKLQLEVSVELQLSDAETVNLTLYGRGNHNTLHLHPLDEEEEETGDDDEGQREAFFCCRPLLPTPESSNQSRCLLWLANQTVLTATVKEKLPWKRTQKDEWKCIFRVVWLVLLCVVLLAIVTLVVKQVCRGKHLFGNSRLHPAGFNASQQLNDVQRQIQTITPRGAALHTYKFHSWSGLSPIQEVENDVETLLDGNVNHCYTGNLHHRSHSSHSHRGAAPLTAAATNAFIDITHKCDENKVSEPF